ncbi:ChbG/HpnK family deacetylase [Azotobacter vinelandii]
MTADDYGLHEAVNEAVERAYREGVLRAASLMVAASAAGDAVERARRMPGLAVGLHLVLADGKAVLPPSLIPDLVDAQGWFNSAMVRNGFRFFFSCPACGASWPPRFVPNSKFSLRPA